MKIYVVCRVSTVCKNYLRLELFFFYINANIYAYAEISAGQQVVFLIRIMTCSNTVFHGAEITVQSTSKKVKIDHTLSQWHPYLSPPYDCLNWKFSPAAGNKECNTSWVCLTVQQDKTLTGRIYSTDSCGGCELLSMFNVSLFYWVFSTSSHCFLFSYPTTAEKTADAMSVSWNALACYEHLSIFHLHVKISLTFFCTRYICIVCSVHFIVHVFACSCYLTVIQSVDVRHSSLWHLFASITILFVLLVLMGRWLSLY